MAGENECVTPVVYSGEEASASRPKEHMLVVDDPTITQPQQAIESQPLCGLDDPIMHVVAQNFNQINAMYMAFSSKVKQTYLRPRSDDPKNDHPLVEVQ
ncbi:hypothetical protein Tco_0904335 [Tanacetum coccineum]